MTPALPGAAVIACRLCGEEARFRFDRAFDALGVARYYECAACGLLRSTHLDGRTPVELRALYPAGPHPADPGFAWRQYCVADRLRRLFRLGGIPSGPDRRVKALDLGCGNGWLLAYLAFRHGCDAVGYDPMADTPTAGVPIRREWDPVARAGPFDLIVATEVFEHFIDVRGEIDRIASVLAPGGCVYVTTGLYDSARHGVTWDYLGTSGQHVAFYAQQTHEWIAAKLGARALRCGAEYEWLYTRAGGVRPALAAGLLRAAVAAGLTPRIV